MADDVAELTAAPLSAPTQSANRAASQLTMQLRLRSIAWEAPGVLSLELTALDGSALPRFEPGAHIDVHLPDGTLRQYSLCGDSADSSRYRIAVRAIESGLASQFIHRTLRPGDVLKVGAPRNNFPLIDARRYIFVAGGIGITPLVPMIRAASANRKPWTLLYCNRRNEDAPFLKEISALPGEISLHSSAAGTRLDVAKRLSMVEESTVVYCCGPEKLMTAVEEATSHWPQDTIRFEWFTPRSRSRDEVSGSFEVECAASGISFTVPPDKSILETLQNAGIEVPRSCEQGICGTCEVGVLSGEVDHRDSILSASERAANTTMMTCVSRAKSSRLLLDI